MGKPKNGKGGAGGGAPSPAKPPQHTNSNSTPSKTLSPPTPSKDSTSLSSSSSRWFGEWTRVAFVAMGISFMLGLLGALVFVFVSNDGHKYAAVAVRDAKRAFKGHKFTQPQHANGVQVVDYSRHDLPPVRMGERVVDLMSGIHFDNLLQDTPDEMRPPSIILFTASETCRGVEDDFKYSIKAETVLPSRERLLIAKYDMDASPHRSWFKFTPEMDLAKRFKVDKCGVLVYAPRACDGYTTWCTEPTEDPEVTKVGCENYVDKCASIIKKYDPSKDGNWVDWVQDLVKQEGEPEISPVLGSYADQARWILDRDETTSDNEARNYYLAEAFPAFTKTGFLAMPIPDEMRSWIMNFWNQRKRNRVTESWHSASTQMSFHEMPTSFVSLDQIAHQRDEIANRVLKPIVEKWSNMKPLELTSFYGIREYKPGNWLRNHIDRIDTHVLSVTFTLGKVNSSNPDQLFTPEQYKALPKWPLEVISYDGQIYRHEHPPDVMILYESSKLAHGRPYRNPGPGHLGAFLHFKPKNMHSEAAAEWDAIAKYARDHQAASTRRGVYRSTAVVEPTNPKFTKLRYADMTGFESSKETKKRKVKTSIAIQIQNESDQPLDVAWINSQTGELQLVGSVSPGTSLQIESYIGHRFQWLKSGTNDKIPQGVFEIEPGKIVYSYSSKAKAVKS